MVKKRKTTSGMSWLVEVLTDILKTFSNIFYNCCCAVLTYQYMLYIVFIVECTFVQYVVCSRISEHSISCCYCWLLPYRVSYSLEHLVTLHMGTLQLIYHRVSAIASFGHGNSWPETVSINKSHLNCQQKLCQDDTSHCYHFFLCFFSVSRNGVVLGHLLEHLEYCVTKGMKIVLIVCQLCVRRNRETNKRGNILFVIFFFIFQIFSGLLVLNFSEVFKARLEPL